MRQCIMTDDIEIAKRMINDDTIVITPTRKWYDREFGKVISEGEIEKLCGRRPKRVIVYDAHLFKDLWKVRLAIYSTQAIDVIEFWEMGSTHGPMPNVIVENGACRKCGMEIGEEYLFCPGCGGGIRRY